MASPNWKLLEAALPAAQLGDWMWMDTVERGGRRIEQYKHRDTRQYVNIDQDGRAWSLKWNGSDATPDAEPIDLADAIARASR